MIHPYGRCEECGERLYEHIEGGYQCHNCDAWYSDDQLDLGLEAEC